MTEVAESAVNVAPAPPVRPGTSPAAGTILTKFADPLRIPPVLRPRHGQRRPSLHITMRATELKLHSELPPTRLWTYEGHSPGPTIEVWRGQRVQVTWSNQIKQPMPLVSVEVPGPLSPLPQPGNTPGRDGAQPRQVIADLPPWTVVHLHGAVTNASNDGLAENAVLPGDSQLVEYLNDQPATALWYHDHAMHVTRFNVMTGLLGMYLIRDEEEEEELRLPRGDREIPLIICDRNLDTDAAGRLTGRLLHKVAKLEDLPGHPTIPFFGPYTLVNGVIWPYLDVAPKWYRFRVLNASNARAYRLFLLDEDGSVISGAIKQIGTDSGLLPRPVSIEGALTLAPAERADILIDFGAFLGRKLRLVNTGGGPGDDGTTPPGQVRPEVGLVEPDVMQFRVGSWRTSDRFVLPSTLSRSFRRITHDSLPHDHGHRWLVITPPVTGHPELWEMAEVDPATVTVPGDGIIQVQVRPGKVVTLRRVARRYEDAVSFFVRHGDWEQWKFLNLGGPMHPMHIHLVNFQAMSRERYDTRTFDPVVGGTTGPVQPLGPGVLEPNEQGWKDTIRVGPAELVSVAGRFSGGTGRFLYHCHILEHEDEGMMRAYLVMPDEVMELMPGTHGGGHEG